MFGQFLIDSHRVTALKGDVNKGLFFSVNEIRPVQDMIDYLLTGVIARVSRRGGIGLHYCNGDEEGGKLPVEILSAVRMASA
jgi:hypothetical protein